MKIVVTTFKSIDGNRHKIEVVDGMGVVYTETVRTLQQRDDIVWDLAEMYNVVDIDIVKGDNVEYYVADAFMFSEIPSIPVLDEDDAQYFFEQESDFVYDRIVQAISEGMERGLEEVRLFELNGTGTYLTAQRGGWKAGLLKAIDYYVSVEEYEECVDIQKMISVL